MYEDLIVRCKNDFYNCFYCIRQNLRGGASVLFCPPPLRAFMLFYCRKKFIFTILTLMFNWLVLVLHCVNFDYSFIVIHFDLIFSRRAQSMSKLMETIYPRNEFFLWSKSGPRAKLQTDLTIVFSGFVMLWNLDLYLRHHKVAFRILVVIVSRFSSYLSFSLSLSLSFSLSLSLSLFLPLSLSLSLSLSLPPSTTALRKLVNLARNCESTRTSWVENDRSNRAFGTRASPKDRRDIHIYTYTQSETRISNCN